MSEVYIVRPYGDGPSEAFRTYSRAWLRKCELDAEHGSAVIETLQIQEDALKPIACPEYGPSGVRMSGGQGRRGF